MHILFTEIENNISKLYWWLLVSSYKLIFFLCTQISIRRNEQIIAGDGFSFLITKKYFLVPPLFMAFVPPNRIWWWSLPLWILALNWPIIRSVLINSTPLFHIFLGEDKFPSAYSLAVSIPSSGESCTKHKWLRFMRHCIAMNGVTKSCNGIIFLHQLRFRNLIKLDCCFSFMLILYLVEI